MLNPDSNASFHASFSMKENLLVFRRATVFLQGPILTLIVPLATSQRSLLCTNQVLQGEWSVFNMLSSTSLSEGLVMK